MPDRQKQTKALRNAEYAAKFPRRSRKKRRALRREKAHRQERDWLAVMGLLDKKDPAVTTPAEKSRPSVVAEGTAERQAA